MSEPVEPEIICTTCNEAIKGPLFEARGFFFHKDHFTCAKCKKDLMGATFGVREGKFFCEEDYLTAFGKLCEKCKQVITGVCIESGGKAWCEEHLTCTKCDKNLEKFRSVDNNPYCDDCYGLLSSYVCRACETTIDHRDHIEALGFHFHFRCFVCSKGDHKIEDKTKYYEFGGKIYCEDHWDEKEHLNKCGACGKLIDHDYVKVCGQEFHTKCWTCGGCKQVIGTKTAAKFDNVYYCTRCAQKEDQKRKDGRVMEPVYAKRLIRGYGEYEAAPGTIPPWESKCYPLATLLLRPPLIPKEIDFRQREQYLEEKEFKKVFGVPMRTFNGYPLWRRLMMKKEVNLF